MTSTRGASVAVVDPEGDVVEISDDIFDAFADPDEDLYAAFLALLDPDTDDVVDDPITDITSFVYDVEDGEFTVEFSDFDALEDETEALMMVMVVVFDTEDVSSPADFDEPAVTVAVLIYANDSTVEATATISVGNDTYDGDVELGDDSFVVTNASAGTSVDEPGAVVMAMRTTVDAFFSGEPEGFIDVAADDALVETMGGDVSEVPGGDDTDGDGEADADAEGGLFDDIFGGSAPSSDTVLLWTQWALIAVLFCVAGFACGSSRNKGVRRK